MSEYVREEAPMGSACEARARSTRHACGKTARVREDGRCYCGTHDPLRMRHNGDPDVYVVEFGYGAAWPTVAAVKVYRRTAGQVRVEACKASGYANTLTLAEFEARFSETPHEAIEAAIRGEVQKIAALQAKIDAHRANEAHLIGMLAALPDDDTAAIAATNPPKGDGGES